MAYRFKHNDRPIEGYTIQRAVGAGGFGEVYYAISDGGREVALKYLRDNPQVELRGISNCINLKSPHLVSIFDVKKSDEGDYFVIMEYCSGPSLRDLLIAETNGFSTEKAAFFAREIAKGLAYLHDRGIVHRDLKPGNIFFDDGYVKIGDYGLSKFIAVSRHSAQTASVGTVHYMAPEIGSGNYQRGVDIYALGVMLYEMLLGKVPFEGSTMGEVLMKHLMSQPQVDNLPEPFAHVIRRSLEKDPKDRYQTVDEMINEMLSGEAVQKSLAGFSPDSLSSAVRRGTPDRAASPTPSPNPAPRRERIGRMFEEAIGEIPLPDRLARKMDRISRKIDQKLAKLGGRTWQMNDHERARRESADERRGPNPAVPFGVSHDGRKRFLLAFMVTLAMAIGVGVLFGNAIKDEVGAAAAMMVLALTGAVPLTRKAIGWLATEAQPRWAKRLVSIVVASPLIFIGGAPIIDSMGPRGLIVTLATLAVAVFGDWSKEIDRGSVGELNIGVAIWKGVGAMVMGFVLCLVFDREPDNFMFVASTVVLAASLNIQAGSWWLRRSNRAAGDNWSGDERVPQPQRPAQQQGNIVVEAADYRRDLDETQPVPRSGSFRPEGSATTPPEPPSVPPGRSVPPGKAVRGDVVRMFWGLVAFGTMCTSIVLILFAALANGLGNEEVTATILGAIGFGCATFFSLAKTTPFRRIGLWQNTLRPFLICSVLFVMGTAITSISRSEGRIGSHKSIHFSNGIVRFSRSERNLRAELAEARQDQARASEEYRRALAARDAMIPPLGRAATEADAFVEVPGLPPRPPVPPAAPAPIDDDVVMWHHRSNEKLAMISVLTVSSLFLVLLLNPFRRRRKKAEAFLRDDSNVPKSVKVEV